MALVDKSRSLYGNPAPANTIQTAAPSIPTRGRNKEGEGLSAAGPISAE